MKHHPTKYQCKTLTEATDRANLWYIASPAAAGIETDHGAKVIKVTSRKGATLATFQY